MTGTSPGQAAPGQPAKNSELQPSGTIPELMAAAPKGQRQELHDRLMRELNERDEFVAKEARKASRGVDFRHLPMWGGMEAALGFHDVLERYATQEDRAGNLLVLPALPARRPARTAPVQRKGLLARAGLIDSDREELFVRPARKPAPKTTSVRRKGLLELSGFVDSDEEEEQVPAPAPAPPNTPPPVPGRPRDLLERYGLLNLVADIEVSTPSDALSLRGSKSGQGGSPRIGESRGGYRGVSDTRSDSAGAFHGRGASSSRSRWGRDSRGDRGGRNNRGDHRGQGSCGGRRAATPDTYPKVWTRWMPYGDQTYVVAFIEQPGTEKKEVRINKLDPRTYGGDLYHDLGLCKAHFTKGQTCLLSWEECPYRHWLIEPLEEPWVDSAWLDGLRAMGLRPLTAPDHARGRYEGMPRQLVSGEWFRSSTESFVGEATGPMTLVDGRSRFGAYPHDI